MASPTIKLSSGHNMPQVGFGLWKVKSAETVYQAIKAGYRLLDGACDYDNEVECGQAVARAIKEGIVKRSDLFIVTKIWPTFYDGERVEPICRRQLADWGVDYFDLYLMHFPIPLAYVDPEVRYPPGFKYDGKSEVRRGTATLQETWAAMEGLVSAGLTRSIGVSNFQAQLLYSLLANARIKPATLQIELHPYLTQVPLVRLCREEGIAVTAYSSFGSSGFMEITSPNMAKMKEVEPLWDLPAIAEIATKHKKEPSQVLLRWATQRGIAVIPKTNRPSMMGVNLDCTGWDLSEEDLETISGLNKNLRFNQPTNYFDSEKLWLFA